jgi:16S rRNA (guanine527-N7)-methyltransferase
MYLQTMPTKDEYSLTDEQVASTLSPFRVELATDQIAKVREYVRLLLKWNQSISLTSVVDPAEIVARHFGESMFANGLIAVENCRLADLGSGAGFPGLALKIACPSLNVVLIESNKKKCAFLSEVVRSLELENVEVLPVRFDETPVSKGYAEIVTARAVGGFSDILHWAETALAHRGHMILWLGGEDSPKVSSTPGWIWQPAVKIPESQRRFLLIGHRKPNESL